MAIVLPLLFVLSACFSVVSAGHMVAFRLLFAAFGYVRCQLVVLPAFRCFLTVDGGFLLSMSLQWMVAVASSIVIPRFTFVLFPPFVAH